VPAALGALEIFLHQQDQIPLLVKIGLAHAQFETIHPFQIVQMLESLGVLREITGQMRHRRFRYDAYVRLFAEGT
jgi:hypothetical protein